MNKTSIDKNEVIKTLSHDIYETLREDLSDKYILQFVDHYYVTHSSADRRKVKSISQAFLQTLNNKLANILTEIEKEVRIKHD